MINKNDVKEKDLRRIRNLYEGKLSTKTNIQIGFEKEHQEHKEGDVWIENEKKWTIRNGIKQTISNLDAIKKDVIMPFTCPSCDKAMKKRLDKKYYKIHKRCMDCVIEAEAEIRNKGLWEVYEKNIMKSNVLDILQDFKSSLYDLIDSNNQSYVTEQGEVENWVGGVNKEESKKQVDMYIETIKEKLSNES